MRYIWPPEGSNFCPDGFQQVDKEEFYRRISKYDVHPELAGKVRDGYAFETFEQTNWRSRQLLGVEYELTHRSNQHCEDIPVAPSNRKKKFFILQEA